MDTEQTSPQMQSFQETAQSTMPQSIAKPASSLPPKTTLILAGIFGVLTIVTVALLYMQTNTASTNPAASTQANLNSASTTATPSTVNTSNLNSLSNSVNSALTTLDGSLTNADTGLNDAPINLN